jgi:FixJ family two-component response regulator
LSEINATSARGGFDFLMPLDAMSPLIGIVDDDPAVLHSLELSLESAGYSVCAFESSAEALASSLVDEVGCWVIDFGLPGMDGIALMQALHRQREGLPTIIIAADPTPRCRRESQAAGASLVEKPVMGDGLIQLVTAKLAATR